MASVLSDAARTALVGDLQRLLGDRCTTTLTQLEHHANIVPWQQICRERGAELRYLEVDWDAAVQRVRRGEADAVIGAFKSDAPDFVFPHEPFGRASYCYFARPDSAWTYQGRSSLEKVRIGVIRTEVRRKDADLVAALTEVGDRPAPDELVPAQVMRRVHVADRQHPHPRQDSPPIPRVMQTFVWGHLAPSWGRRIRAEARSWTCTQERNPSMTRRVLPPLLLALLLAVPGAGTAPSGITRPRKRSVLVGAAL